jgi:hypothetical protein
MSAKLILFPKSNLIRFPVADRTPSVGDTGPAAFPSAAGPPHSLCLVDGSHAEKPRGRGRFAFLNFGLWAMILPSGVRHTLRRLIASQTDADPRLAIVAYGFSEGRAGYGTARRQVSAERPRQCAGGRSAEHDVEAVLAYLRQMYPTQTYYSIAADTGIAAGTIENWFMRKAKPSASHFAGLIAAYGPQFLAAVLTVKPEWVERAAKYERALAIDRHIEDLRREKEALLDGAL